MLPRLAASSLNFARAFGLDRSLQAPSRSRVGNCCEAADRAHDAACRKKRTCYAEADQSQRHREVEQQQAIPQNGRGGGIQGHEQHGTAELRALQPCARKVVRLADPNGVARRLAPHAIGLGDMGDRSQRGRLQVFTRPDAEVESELAS